MKTEYITRPIVQIDGLSKEFAIGDGSFLALDNISIMIAAGEMVAIMGPSGSGKSTLMTMIGLLDQPTRGTYLLDGQEVSGLSRTEQAHVRNEKIGFVFQNFNLLPRLSAQKNVELPLVYGRVGAGERAQLARAALEAVGLGSKLDSLPSTLSGGQKQRVAIARALAMRPRLILFDEPTSSLDPELVAGVLDIIRALAEDGLTLVVVSHEMGFARKLGDVIHFIADGVILESGPPEQIFDNPTNPRLSGFIRSILH
jgi:putative ABC transport system ATP-binding protein